MPIYFWTKPNSQRSFQLVNAQVRCEDSGIRQEFRFCQIDFEPLKALATSTTLILAAFGWNRLRDWNRGSFPSTWHLFHLAVGRRAMLCDAVSEEEIFEAYLLYASLHGMPTGEEEVRQRITSYLNNVPDSIIDEALLAYAEDRIIAPPDVVLPQWGRSRIYELVQTPQQEWRHQVCESWFENDCEFHNDSRDPELYHYWTQLTLNAEFNQLLHSLVVGTRLQFRLEDGQVRVCHRQLGYVGKLPGILTEEILQDSHKDPRYLVLVDAAGASAADATTLPAMSTQTQAAHSAPATCRLLTTVAGPGIGLGPIIAYARQAFSAARAKC